MSYAILEAWENEPHVWDYLKRSLREGGAFQKGADQAEAPYARHSGKAPGISKQGAGGRRRPLDKGGFGNSEDSSILEASIYDTGSSIVIKAKMPGVALEDIHVELMDNILMLRVEKEGETTPEEAIEGAGSSDVRTLKKSFVLPGSVYLFPELIRATLANGVFRLEILKHG